MNKVKKGFSLIEVLIVMAIVAILGAVSVPLYSNYVTQGRIQDATSDLSARRNEMEQFFQDKLSYCGPATGTCDAVNACQGNSDFFAYTCPTRTRETFVITATGTGAMTGFTYTINEKGDKTTNITKKGWEVSNVSCWVMKQGGGC